jgi:hypothetical protein
MVPRAPDSWYFAQFAADVRIRARAWMLDAVLDVDSHPHLLNLNGNETGISHEYVKNVPEQCESYCVNILNTVRGLDLISFSIPKPRSSRVELAEQELCTYDGSYAWRAWYQSAYRTWNVWPYERFLFCFDGVATLFRTRHATQDLRGTCHVQNVSWLQLHYTAWSLYTYLSWLQRRQFS